MANEIYHRSNWGESKPEDFGDMYFDSSATNKLYNRSTYYENSDATDKILGDIPNKASIVLTPTGYSEDKIGSVIPVDGNGDFTFARNSSATRVNQAGLIEDVNSGTELVSNGDFSDGTNNFTTQLNPNFSVTNGVATIESTGANSLIFQNISPSSVSAILKIEIDVVSFTGSNFSVNFSGSTTTINELGISTHLTSPSRSTNKMDISPSANQTIVIRSISVKEVYEATDIPRLDYTTGQGAFLLEPQSTNLITYSEDLISGIVQKNGGNTSLAVTVRVNPCKSPAALPETIVPPVTSPPLSLPTNILFVVPAPSGYISTT
jgi:hypothetical protein